MPTTTNFGWTTPADTDLVKDGAAAIRTLGNGVDTSLVDLKGGTTGQVLAKASNTDMDFSWVAQDDSNAIQNALLTTTGDTIYASAASTPARLGIGSTGQVLTVAGGVPSWATPASGGKVLQVVQATTSTSTSVTSATFTDSGLSASITPSAATSKILVMTMQALASSRSTNPTSGRMRLLRDSTTVWDGNGTGGGMFRVFATAVVNDGLDLNALQNVVYLDSPATTSSTTYKTQLRVQDADNASTITAQAASRTGVMILMEIGA